MFLDALPNVPSGDTAWSSLPLIEWIKVVANIATVLIAIVNVLFAIFFFWRKDRKENKDKKRDIRIAWFKNLILDYTMESFYEFFENVENAMETLTKDNVSPGEKRAVDASILSEQIRLRKKFIDTLLAVDIGLYQKAMDDIDLLTDALKATIFDPGINLSHKPMFEEKVLRPISEKRTDILKHLFAYEGA